MEVTAKFLEMLLAGASREDLDAGHRRGGGLGREPRERSTALREQHALALRIHELMARQRNREAELTALYETARDLTAIRDLDAILAAIVRRARQLLGADMTYLSLNDEAEGASYMKVTDGALTPEFRELRLPLGTGLLGLVAQSGAPYFTEDYQADERFVHRDYIDSAVAGEEIRAILGVPLTVEGTVIGALLAVHRTVRPFPAGEVALLTSFAAHAAVALENARLFEQARAAVAEAAEANAELRARNEADRTGGPAPTTGSPTCCSTVAGWSRWPTCSPTCSAAASRCTTSEGRLLAGEDHPGSRGDAVERARTSGRTRAGRGRLGGRRGRRRRAPRHPGPAHRRSPWTSPSDAPSSVAPWSRPWSCSSDAPRPRRRAGSAASCSATWSAAATSTHTRLRERARQQGADLDGELAIAVAVAGVRAAGSAASPAVLAPRAARPRRRRTRAGSWSSAPEEPRRARSSSYATAPRRRPRSA